MQRITVKFRDLPQDIQREIKIEMKIQSKLGKKTYKDVWVGSGWISLDKNNTLTFKEVSNVQHR